MRVRAGAAGRLTASLTVTRRRARKLGLVARVRRVRIARRARTAPARKWVAVRLRPRRRIRLKLRDARSLPARLTVGLRAKDGRRATARRAVRFRRRATSA